MVVALKLQCFKYCIPYHYRGTCWGSANAAVTVIMVQARILLLVSLSDMKFFEETSSSRAFFEYNSPFQIILDEIVRMW